MNFQQSLCRVLSDPNFEPPECLFELNLKGSFKDLLTSCSKKICVKFSIDEVKLVLSFFEGAYPDDDRPREAIEAAEKWRNLKVGAYTAARAAAHTAYIASHTAARAAETSDAVDVADVAYAAYYAATAAIAAAEAAAAADIAYAAHYAATAAYNARRADSNVTLEDQLRRLFNSC